MSIFYLGSTNSDLTAGQSFSKYLEQSTETAGTISITRNDNSTYQTDYAFTRGSIPDNPAWESGSIAVKVRVTAVNRSITMRVSASRVNSSGAVQETTSTTATQSLSSAGTTYTFTIPSYSWSGGANGDRLRINYESVGSHHVQNSSVTIQTGTIETEVNTPIEISPFDEPTISTSAASSVGVFSATLNGNLTYVGDSASVDVFFEWREVGGPTWNSTTKQNRSTTGTFSQEISGLTHNTSHEFRAVVEYENNGTQRIEGSILTFNTHVFSEPTISTGTATDLDLYTATLNGNVDGLGDSSSVEGYFRYRSNFGGSPGEWVNTTPQTLNSVGGYSAGISGLVDGQNYEFQAVADYTHEGTNIVYGEIVGFSTVAMTSGGSNAGVSVSNTGVGKGSKISGSEISLEINVLGDGEKSVGGESESYVEIESSGESEKISYLGSSVGVGIESYSYGIRVSLGGTETGIDIMSEAGGTIFVPEVFVYFQYRLVGEQSWSESDQVRVNEGFFGQSYYLAFEFEPAGLDLGTYEFRAVTAWVDSGGQDVYQYGEIKQAELSVEEYEGGSEALVISEGSGIGEGIRESGIVAGIEIESEGKGNTEKAGGSESVVVAETYGESLTGREGGSEPVVGVNTGGGALLIAGGGSETGINAGAGGYGNTEKAGGNNSVVSIEGQMGNESLREGGSESRVKAITQGGIDFIVSGKAEAEVGVYAEGDHKSIKEGGSESVCSLVGEGYGDKNVGSGSDSWVESGNEAAGEKRALGSSEVYSVVENEAGASKGAGGGDEAGVEIGEGSGGIKIYSRGTETEVGIDNYAFGEKLGAGGVGSILDIGTYGESKKYAESGTGSEILVVGEGNGKGIVMVITLPVLEMGPSSAVLRGRVNVPDGYFDQEAG